PKAKSLSDLLGIEGTAASSYWAAWTAIEIKWRKSARYPIQDDWLRFSSRSSLFEAHKMANVRATHPVNAMLNYAYAILLSEARLKAIADGFDPQIGIVHFRDRGRRGGERPSFALDVMEPSRPVVDRAVLKLIEEETFSGADFQLQLDGVCRLNPELARQVASAALKHVQLVRKV
ncbi:MAG: CRISPR-associated endonuclease Cas1, partial [Proteobacteria bacterium]